MTYQQPKQKRARESEQRILEAFGQLLMERSYHDTTIDLVAEQASVSHGAVMARFGSKRNLLSCLFGLFCDDVQQALADFSKTFIPKGVPLPQCLFIVSKKYERLVLTHWGANRAMHEVFLKEGEIDDQTKRIFKATVETLHPIFCEILGKPLPIERSFAAVQLLVTLNYNQVLGATPGLPEEALARHTLISQTMLAAIGSP